MADEAEPIVLTFGGGINIRRRPMDIDINECTLGENFDLSPEQLALQKRAPFDLAGTAPNGQAINGLAQLIKRDGTITTLVQAGTTVYSWDGASTFTSVGTVLAGTKLRGPREQIFSLDDLVLITDLAKIDVVKKWDGTTFSDLAHNLGTTFLAKYCRVFNERAVFANVKSGTSDLPHMLIVSERENSQTLTVTDRPAGTLSLADPVFLLTPDLKPINGLEEGFGKMLFSTTHGRLYALSGTSAFDYSADPFYAGSTVAGDEAMVNIGNDIAMGLRGRIETLSGTINFGDVEANDLSRDIAPLIETVTDWTLAYDQRKQRLICFPDNVSAAYVYYKSIGVQNVSPWSKWTTGHQVGMQPTTVMALTDPDSGEDRVYFGDTVGRIFKFDGSGGTDGGTTTVALSRTSGLIRGIPEGNVMDVEGWVVYRREFEATVTLTFQFAGEGLFDKSITVNLPATDSIPVYNGEGDNAGYYAGDFYYGASFAERLNRQGFGPPGLNAWFQVKVDVSSEGDANIQEIGIKFRTAA